MIIFSAFKDFEAQCLGCRACNLRDGCRQVVFGEGDPTAAVMFVGEAPGVEEDRQGRPFVGAAGKLLDRLLAYAEFSREEVYITNVVKCRPPGNRTPTIHEAAACRPYLFEQIRLIRPEIIVCLGALATQTIVDPQARVTRVRGQWFERNGAKVLPTFHPAAVLRDRERLQPVAMDFRELGSARRALEEAREEVPDQAEQLSPDFSGCGNG